MSALARTALRLAAVNALNADTTVGVMCKGCIYDSRIVDLDQTEPVPVIIVMTEDENGDHFSRNNGGPPFNSTVDLVLEISMKAIVPAAPGSAEVDLMVPYTDSELEAVLDLLEERCIDALTIADTPQSYLVRSQVTRRVSKMRSSRFVLDNTGTKLATRLLTLTTELKNPAPDDLLNPPTGPFAVLPDPLRTICGALDPESPGYATCKAIVAQIIRPVPHRLRGVDVEYDERQQLDPHQSPRDRPDGPSDLIEQKIDIHDRRDRP